MPGEAISFPENVGDEALAGFHDEAQRTSDFAEAGIGPDPSGPVNVNAQANAQPQPSWEEQQANFQEEMNGVRHQGGTQHDLQTKGYSSDNSVEDARNFQQTQWNDLETNVQVPLHNYQGDQVANQDFQNMYGQSENEKGELRKALQAQMDANNQLLSRMNQVSNPQTPLPQFFAASPQRQEQPVNSPQVQNTAVPQSPNFKDVRFLAKEDDEMVLASDLNKVIQEQVAPYVYDAYQQAAEARNQTSVVQKQLFESQKLQMGITPQIEQMAIAQQPWMANVGTPEAYLGALHNFKATMDRAQLLEQQQPNPIPQARQNVSSNPQARRMVRRTTYVEGQGQAMAGEPSQGPSNAMAQWEAAWSQSEALPFAERAAVQRELLKTRGVGQVSGYRSPNVLTK